MSGKSVLERNIKIDNSKKTPQVYSKCWNESKQHLQRKLAVTLKHSAICLKWLIKNFSHDCFSFENKLGDSFKYRK